MFEKEILERLQEMYRRGMTHDELSKALGISASYIGNILSGKQPVKNPTVDLLFKVFPRAVVNLEGQTNIAAENNGNMVANSGSGNFFTDRSAADFKAKVISAVIKLDLPPDAMQTVLKAIDAL